MDEDNQYYAPAVTEIITKQEQVLNTWISNRIDLGPITYHPPLLRRLLNRILHAYNTFLDKLAISTSEFIDSF